jgi:ribosomal protein S18 acetylase RimI-like enzyme
MTIMDITIRPAKPEDIPQLCDLLAELFSIETDFEIDLVKQVKGLSMLVTDPSGSSLVLVAVAQGGAVIGMATVQTLVSTAEGGRVGLVEDVVVDSRWRCRGVGTRLLARIIDWSRENKFTRLQLLADRTNHVAVDFYCSRGWSATSLNCMRIML